MQHLPPIMAMQGLIITVPALGAAWLARRVRLPGWTGALMVGLALGAVLHSHWSGLSFEPFFIGGQPQMHAIEKYTEQHRGERRALVETGVTNEAVRELDRQHAAAMQPLIDAHAAEVTRHHDATRVLTLLIASLLLLIVAGDKPKRPGDALPVALGAGLCISVAAYIAAWLLLKSDPMQWALLTAGCAAAALPISKRYLAGFDDDSRALLTSVAWWLLTIALAISAGVHPKFGPSPVLMLCFLTLTLIARACDAMLARAASPQPAWRLLIALALAAAWLRLTHGTSLPGALLPEALLPGAGALLPGAWIVGQVLIGSNFDPRALMRLIGPIVALLVGMSANVLADFHPWLVLAALVALCDARALGAWLMIRLLGGRGRDGLRSGAILAVPGPTPLVVAWFLHDSRVIDAPLFNALILAALIGGLLGGAVLRLLNTHTERPAYTLRA
ncbi:MAG: cation:proton antiporter domain-containing protein [Phycisphaerales bacterium]